MAAKNSRRLRAAKSKKPKQPVDHDSLEVQSVEQAERNVTHRPFRLSDATVIDNSGLPNSFQLLWETVKQLYRYRFRTFFFILSYGVIWYLLTASQSNSPTSAAYSAIIAIIASLASIWMVRHWQAGERVTIRLAYYRGMVQLIPFFLVVLVMVVQLLPIYIGFAIYNIAIQSGAIATSLEQAVPLILWGFLSLLSLYWVSATLMALYVVTIPDALPMAALKAGKKLVDGRRWFISRRLLIGGLILMGIYALFAFWFANNKWAGALEQLSIIFPIVTIPAIHTYLYKLYKSLL